MQIKPIEINGKKFESRKAACDYFKISGFKLLWLVKKYGYTIPETAFKDQRGTNFANVNIQKRKASSLYCKVKCIEDNKIYPSIAAAARACKVSDWTMGVKMQAAGKFERDGKTYVRLSPMKTNKVYKNTGAVIQMERGKWLRKNKKNKEEVITSTSAVVSSMDMARNIIKTELINRINQNNWQEAGALLEVITKLQ